MVTRIVALVGCVFARQEAGWNWGLLVGQETGAVYCWSEGSASHFCWHLFSSLTNHLGLLGLLARFI